MQWTIKKFYHYIRLYYLQPAGPIRAWPIGSSCSAAPHRRAIRPWRAAAVGCGTGAQPIYNQFSYSCSCSAAENSAAEQLIWHIEKASKNFIAFAPKK